MKDDYKISFIFHSFCTGLKGFYCKPVIYAHMSCYVMDTTLLLNVLRCQNLWSRLMYCHFDCDEIRTEFSNKDLEHGYATDCLKFSLRILMYMAGMTIKHYEFPLLGILRQKGGDLTQSYDKSPYTNRNVKGTK